MGQDLEKFEDLPEVVEHLDNLALLTDIAIGDYEKDEDVYRRHGLTEKQWKFLNGTEAFKTAVLKVRTELERNGRMTQTKARLMADDLMEVIYREAMNPEIPVALEKRLEVLRTFAKLADLEPKTNLNAKGGQGGPAFAIQINISQPTAKAEVSPVEIEAEE